MNKAALTVAVVIVATFLVTGGCVGMPSIPSQLDLVTQPDLVNCRASTVSQDCRPGGCPGCEGNKPNSDSVRAIAIPASIGRMQALYENERATVYVNRDKYMTYLDSETRNARYARKEALEEMKVAFEAGRTVEETMNIEHWGAAHARIVYDFTIESIGSSHFAVYDKLEKACVTTLLRRDYSFRCGELCGGGFISIYLPDCTLLFTVPTWRA